jgi:RNA polymerase sigma-70 factor (ECF subfamily)
MPDATTFEDWMRSYQNMVYSTALRLLTNEADALDISQEVCLKAYERFSMLQDNPAAGGWLKKVTTNLSLNHLTRYRSRWRFFSDLLRDSPGMPMEDLLGHDPERDGLEDEDFRRRYLDQALRKLPDTQRIPLVLYHFEDMSYETIAAQLGVSLSKVKSDIHRGRESLRRWLKPNMNDWQEAPPGPVTRAGDPSLDRSLFRWPWTVSSQGSPLN